MAAEHARYTCVYVIERVRGTTHVREIEGEGIERGGGSTVYMSLRRECALDKIIMDAARNGSHGRTVSPFPVYALIYEFQWVGV